MLSADQRKYATEVWQGASDFHRSWITDLIAAADHGHAKSERTLRIFLKHRRATERTAVAYHKTMDDLAQIALWEDRGDTVGVDDAKRTEGSPDA